MSFEEHCSRHSPFSLLAMSLNLTTGLSKECEPSSTVCLGLDRGCGLRRSRGRNMMKTTTPKRVVRAMKPMTVPAMAPPLRTAEVRLGRGRRYAAMNNNTDLYEYDTNTNNFNSRHTNQSEN